MKTVMVVGSGGREHALAWRIAQDAQVTRIILAPGNDGVLEEKTPRLEVIRYRGAKYTSFDDCKALTRYAKENQVDFCVVGPDHPISLGLVDELIKTGIPAFGPSMKASRLESSKAFAKEVLKSAGVPTARFFTADSLESAMKGLQDFPFKNGIVVKADGLALGKGVVVCEKKEEALDAVHSLSKYGSHFVIEEKLNGEELSLFALCDGETALYAGCARDYKRLNDGQEGPNTGGMGAFSPVEKWNTPSFQKRWLDEVFTPVLKEMKKRGSPYHGVLYAGLMIDQDENYGVLEFNARWGDPEAQVVLPRIQGDFTSLLSHTVNSGDLKKIPALKFQADYFTVVVVSTKGYPEAPELGAPIENASPISLSSPHLHCFFAGVKKSEERSYLLTSGGRVMGLMGQGKNLEEARLKAYQNLGKIHFKGMHHRNDVALEKRGGAK